MKQRMSSEFIYQLFALLIAIIVVHALYVGVIRPSAKAHLEREAALQAAGEEVVTTRSLAVVIGDYEQESCFILLIWALAIMGYKGRRGMHERSMLERRLLDIPEGTTVLPEDARDALGQAYKAVEGDISGVTASLGVAFNSTFVALVLSIIIMFCLHQLQLSQERLVLDSQRYADRRLLRFLVAN